MDHLQSKDHAFFHSAKEDNTPIEESESVELLVVTQADPTAANTEADLVWKQFIHQELESLQNPEKVERNPMPKEAALEPSSRASLEQVLVAMIEKIPVERMIDSAVRFLRQKTEPDSEKRSRRHRRR
jgi:hypothetical protein